MKLRRNTIREIKALLREHGYRPAATPAIENANGRLVLDLEGSREPFRFEYRGLNGELLTGDQVVEQVARYVMSTRNGASTAGVQAAAHSFPGLSQDRSRARLAAEGTGAGGSNGGASLTSEQAEVVAVPPDVQLLVKARAGTGKTHTLIARIAHLVDDHHVSPGHELLVLSFSRNAVKEIRDRLKRCEGDASYVRAQTFDSFATRLLRQSLPDSEYVELGYDDRIRRAIRQIAEDSTVRHFLSGYRHVCVDEIQDLVGVRAELVVAVLKAVRGGFTLLGDPAQAIYGFQVKHEPGDWPSGHIFTELDRRYPGLSIKGLSENFRARTELSKIALWAGPRLAAEDPDFDDIHERLSTIVSDLDGLNIRNLRVFAGNLDETHQGAILCRTNGEALYVSRSMDEMEIPHRLQRSASDRAVAPWVALVLGDAESTQIGRSVFEERYAEYRDDTMPDVEDAWHLLKRLEGERGNSLKIDRLARRLATGSVLDELSFVPRATIIVSTIHRAKGLEFERVAVGMMERDSHSLEELPENTRVLYVALTRPRDEIWRLDGFPGAFQIPWRDKASGRWYKRGQKTWQRFGIELTGEDVDRTEPAHRDEGGDDVATVQHRIRKNVEPGDRLTFTLTSVEENDERRARYAVFHGSGYVGETSEYFGASLLRLMKINSRWNVRWPTRIEDVRVDCVDSVAAQPFHADGEDAPRRVWLRVRPRGLGIFVYEKERGS